MNPELTRNAWLELTPLRLWALPFVVFAMAIVASALDQQNAVFGVSWIALRDLGLMICGVFAAWGASSAARSVTDEVVGATWDQQLLAEHRPWELLVGKLVGSTAFAWLGVVLGLGLFALGSLFDTRVDAIAMDVLALALGVTWLYSLALFGSLAMAAGLRAVRRPGGQHASHVAVLIGVLALALFVATPLLQSLSGGEISHVRVRWWWEMPISSFFPLSFAMFTGWTLLGAHRILRAELQETVSPLPWIGFLLFLAAYLYPFASQHAHAHVLPRGVLFCVIQAVVCGLLFHPLLLSERLNLVRVRSLAAAWSRGDGAGVWTGLPLWTFNLVGFGLSLGGIAVGGASGAPFGTVVMVALEASFGLFMLRDLALTLAIHLAPAPGRRPDHVVWFFLAVLYLLLPLVFAVMGEQTHDIAYFFLPLLPVIQTAESAPTADVLQAVLMGLPGAGLAWAIAWFRLRRALAPAANLDS